MKIGYLGAGAWGYCLASVLAKNGHKVTLWTANVVLAETLTQKKQHPKLPNHPVHENITVTTNLEEAVTGQDMIVESITSVGIRPVFEQVQSITTLKCPVVITSKGIEQNTGLLLPEILVDVLKDKSLIGCLSGPGMAEDVIRKLPTSIAYSAYDPGAMKMIGEAFTTSYFRIYPNPDINGIAFGGAMKNPIAIAAGISDGLGYGDSSKAALITRGLHEMRKLSVVKGCNPETLNGLAGLGDLCVTCLSNLSRNYTFGKLIASGLTVDEAKKKIGMVVEGSYACLSAFQLAQKANIPVPITQAVHSILYENVNPKDAVMTLLRREVKEEHL